MWICGDETENADKSYEEKTSTAINEQFRAKRAFVSLIEPYCFNPVICIIKYTFSLKYMLKSNCLLKEDCDVQACKNRKNTFTWMLN